MADKDVEEKFNALALAFKTDKQTLDKRMEVKQKICWRKIRHLFMSLHFF